MAQITLRDVYKSYGTVPAVDGVSIDVHDGEFVALVGPSGCGKTTTLNLVAGLIELTDGEIYVGDRLVNDLDPKDRDLAMVFQNYALYPNKSVFDNLAFPLKMRKLGKADIEERVRKTAKILNIEMLLDRRPRQLSGGQQQRVALGRALVRNPAAFLMDEPLSNLDAKLRVQMRAELKRFHQELGATILYVTHDQVEAVTMADKMAVMSGGVMQQYGSPKEIYDGPVNTFVASFVGSPAMNLIAADVTTDAQGRTALGGASGWTLPLLDRNARVAKTSTGKVVAGVRHGHIGILTEETDIAIPARVYTVEPTGDITYVHILLDGETLVASVPPETPLHPDQPVWLRLDEDHLHLFEATDGVRLNDGTGRGGGAGTIAAASSVTI